MAYVLPTFRIIEKALVISALAKTKVPRARCEVTTAGSAPESTVTMPNITCPHNKTRVRVASFVILLDHR